MYWHNIGLGLLPVVVMAFFWLAIIVIAVALIVRLAGGGSGSSGGSRSDTAEDLLKQRYARGEITKDQYDSMLMDLRK